MAELAEDGYVVQNKIGRQLQVQGGDDLLFRWVVFSSDTGAIFSQPTQTTTGDVEANHKKSRKGHTVQSSGCLLHFSLAMKSMRNETIYYYTLYKIKFYFGFPIFYRWMANYHKMDACDSKSKYIIMEMETSGSSPNLCISCFSISSFEFLKKFQLFGI